MRVERQVLFWLVAGVLLILLIGLLKAVLLPFVVGIAVAYFVSPLVDRLTALGLPRVLASALIIAVVVAIGIAVLVFVVPLILDQAQQLAAALPGEVDRLKGMLEAWARAHLGSRFPQFEAGLASATNALSDNWANIASWAATSLWSGSVALFNFIALMLVTPLVIFYILVDWHPMLEKIDGWLPRDHAPAIRRLASDVNDAVAAFVRGQGTVCFVLAVFYATGLSMIGLNYGLLVGLATGLICFVPFVGWALGLITAATLAIVQFWPDPTPLFMVGGLYLGGQALDAGFLSPKIVGSKIGLHPVWLIFALFVFSYLFGIVGVLVAVPVAAAIGVIVRFALNVYLDSPVYRGNGTAAASGSGEGTA